MLTLQIAFSDKRLMLLAGTFDFMDGSNADGHYEIRLKGVTLFQASFLVQVFRKPFYLFKELLSHDSVVSHHGAGR